MGWLSRFFRFGRKNDDVAAIFEKLDRFLNDDAEQNARLPEEIRGLLSAGEAIDIFPGATGEFGLCADNPIPVNGPIGEITYLSSLILNDGRGIWAHRLGAIDRVDVYEVVSEDGQEWFLLYMSAYHPRKSALTPRGFRFKDAPRVKGVFATNQTVPEFPVGLQEAIRDWSNETLGIPLRSIGLTTALHEVGFERPVSHLAIIQSLALDGRPPHQTDAREIVLNGFTRNKLLNPLIALMKKNIGYSELDVAEVSMFCISLMTFFYLHAGPRDPDFQMLERFHLANVEDMVTVSTPLPSAMRRFQTRYREYSALLRPVLDVHKDQGHHMTTLFMHLCERASHASAQGKMLKIITHTYIIAALINDACNFAKRLARPRSGGE